MIKFSKDKFLPLYIIGATLTLILMVFLIIKLSFSAELLNDTEVEPDTPLTYYLDVSYDGVDRLGVESSDTVVAEIRSGYIFVEDKIPEGLTFTSFVTTEDGTIGAVDRNEGNACVGSVVDDTNEASVTEGTWNQGNTEFTYHGLHYDATTNKVSFKVRNLKAGCVLTVGIVTQTPDAIDDPNTVEVETRRDFYNTANARENSLSVNSNTLHAFMGSQSATLYTVSYQYTGTAPSAAISVLPSSSSYEENAKVNVANNVNIEGYSFSGWTANGITIVDGVFTMPNTNVVLTGSFTELSKNTVTYEVEDPVPDNYEVPSEKEYYPNTSVDIDALKEGDVLNGYRFTGWESEDVTLDNEDNFIMPNNDVTLRGGFRSVTYKVTYAFYDTVLPPNSSSLLPEEVEYAPGAEVTLPTINNQPGYQFLGWYHEDNFEMPEEDIVIYGEWRRVLGEFEVEIEKEIVSPKEYYETGDTVNFTITVTNPNNFALTDVIVKELNDDTVYSSGSGYTVTSDHFVTISNMAANASVVINASYVVKSTDRIVENTAEVTGALAVNGYSLQDGDYTSTVTFGKQPIIKVCNNMDPDLGNKIKFKLTSSDGNYETWLNLANEECKETKVSVGSYKVKELIPQEYEIDSITGAVTEDNTSFTISAGQTKQITYNNEFVNKGFLHSSGNKNNKIGNPISFVNRQNSNAITVGDEIAIDTEHFYVVSSDSNETVLLAKYNLLVGDIFDFDDNTSNYALVKTLSSSDTGYGLQNSEAKGWIPLEQNETTARYIGTVAFSGTNYWDNSVCQKTGISWGCTGTSGLLPEYSQNGEAYFTSPYPYVYRSNIGNNISPQIAYDPTYGYAQNNGYTISYFVEQYKNKLIELGAPNTIAGRLLSFEEAVSLGCSEIDYMCSPVDIGNSNSPTDGTAPTWVYSTTYWLGSAYYDNSLWFIFPAGHFNNSCEGYDDGKGVRPVIEIPTSELN